MGWASGSEIAAAIVKEAKKAIPDKKKRSKFYARLIDIFENADCDTLDEATGIDKLFDVEFDIKHPPDPEFDEE